MHPPEILFKERQRFNQIWLWGIIIAAFFIPVIQDYNGYIAIFKSGVYNDVYKSQLISIALIIFLRICRVDTEIYSDKICCRFFPLQIKLREIKFIDINKAFIRRYNPILDYGGWGFRLGLFGKGQAINTSGNMGLQLEMMNGDRLLIGTQKWQELNLVIEKLHPDTKTTPSTV